MVLLPLPLSPASATISRAPMARLTSSTACRVWRDSTPPILKCLVSRSVLSSGSSAVSVTSARPVRPRPARSGSVRPGGIEEAPHQRVLYGDQVRIGLGADGHDLGAARREPAALLTPGQVRRPAGDAGQRHPLAPDRREGLHQADAVGVPRGVEDAPGGAPLGDL